MGTSTLGYMSFLAVMPLFQGSGVFTLPDFNILLSQADVQDYQCRHYKPVVQHNQPMVALDPERTAKLERRPRGLQLLQPAGNSRKRDRPRLRQLHTLSPGLVKHWRRDGYHSFVGRGQLNRRECVCG